MSENFEQNMYNTLYSKYTFQKLYLIWSEIDYDISIVRSINAFRQTFWSTVISGQGSVVVLKCILVIDWEEGVDETRFLHFIEYSDN